MEIEDRVEDLVEDKIADRPDLFIVDIIMQPGGLLLILIDGDNGVGIQDCAAISRYVGFHLEEENIIENAYNLEVSTPGIDAPLKLKRQYTKNIGRTVTIKFKGGNLKEGKLLEVTSSYVKIDAVLGAVKKAGLQKGKKVSTEEIEIPIEDIEETKVIVSFK